MTTRKIYFTKLVLAFTISSIITLLLMLPALALADNGKAPYQDEPYRTESFELEGPGKLKVKTAGGHITVKGSATNTVKVEMYVQKNGRNLLPEDTDLENWEINISQSGNSVQAVAKNKDGGSWKLFGQDNRASISFVVYTPREMNSNLRTSGGHIETEGLSGNQQISTSGGHLNLANLEGTIEARTSGGHIRISDISGDLDARTSGGHINVDNSEGKIRVKTSGGHIDLADVSGSIEASTSGGSIKADLKSIDNFVDLRTSGGNVNIRIPQNIGLDLNLRGSYVSTNLKNFSGEVDRDEVQGKLNGGGAKISARTSGGTVSLSFQ